MSSEGKTPPIRIPIELTIEDDEYIKVHEAIGRRKKTRDQLEKAQLEREQKKIEKEERKLEREDKKRDKEERKLGKKLEREDKKRDKEVQKLLDIRAAKVEKEILAVIKKRDQRNKNIMRGLEMVPGAISNPLGFLKSLAGRVAPIVLALIIIDGIRTITEALTRKGSFFDLTFRNRIDDRINVLRSRESQQQIRAGFEGKSQLITTTRAGTTNPVFSYNSYEQRNNDLLTHEKMRAIRSPDGI